MILNHDCVRDVLKTIEAYPYKQLIRMDTLLGMLPEYEIDELEYTCAKLVEGCFIDANVTHLKTHDQIRTIRGLTYQGHDLLECIRADSAWGKIKAVIKDAGNVSVETIRDVARAYGVKRFSELVGL